MASLVHVLDHPLVQHKLTLMRKRDTSTASFRRLLEEISLLMGYEVTREMALDLEEIETPLARMRAPILHGKKLCIVSILRAGDGILRGILELVPSARIGHIGLYRDPNTLEPVEYFFKIPGQLEDRDVLVVDPMLATGNSAAAAVARIREHHPKSIKFLCLLAAPEGLAVFHARHPDVPVYCAAVDERLDEHGYIVPGLGDAGDRLFGTKCATVRRRVGAPPLDRIGLTEGGVSPSDRSKMEGEDRSMQRQWAVPMVLLASLALALFGGVYALDYYFLNPPSIPGDNALDYYLRFEPDKITDATSSLAAMVAAVFGIVITVVSIIVQLSADRYTGVARMFLQDRVNLAVMGYYVVATVAGIWLSVGLREGFAPRLSLLAMLVAATVALVLMAPYFGYVFGFVEPMNIIKRIRTQALHLAAVGSRETAADRCADAQVAALSAMEELTDITSNSISGKDKIIASGAVDALMDFTLEYLKRKPQASEAWFNIGPGIRENPDFVAMDPESLADLAERRTWVEWKVMRQYLGIYNEALVPMRDINYLIAIDTRYIGEAAGEAKDEELVRLVFRFMNSYLRSTLNAREVRTAYNVLNQYRLLVEAMIRQQHDDIALEGVRHMLYYGHVSFDMKVTFVTETVAYDVSGILAYAHEQRSAGEQEMLAEFLELDRPLRVRSQEKDLLGVRKAQVKLAAYYLLHGDEAKARTIADDMRAEPVERLLAIREQLEKVSTKDFWEIIDRGRNFEYMPPEQRAELARFFEWFERAE